MKRTNYLVIAFLTTVLYISSNNLGNASTNEDNTSAIINNYNYKIQEISSNNNGKYIYGMAYIPEGIEGEMPTVIISHGYNGTYESNISYAELLAQKGYVCYLFDFCGGSNRSKSEGPTTEMSIFTEEKDLVSVIETLKGLDFVNAEKLFLIGISQGGMVSAMVAADYPDCIKGLVLIFPAFAIPYDAQAKFGTLKNVPETVDIMGMTLSRIYYEKLFNYDPYTDIIRYTKNVLIIHGDRDELVNIEYSERAINVYQSAELKIIPGAGHGFQGSDAELVNSYILDYLNINHE